MDKAIQNCFDICSSSKHLGIGAVQSRAIYNGRTEEVNNFFYLEEFVVHKLNGSSAVSDSGSAVSCFTSCLMSMNPSSDGIAS